MDGDALSVEDLACPICMERLRDPFVTPCGHSFCYSCIMTHLHNKNVCPCCSVYLTSDKVFPNYLLSKVVAKAAKAELRRKGTLVEQLQEAINSEEQILRLPDLDVLLETLEEKKHDMQLKEKENSLELLLHFLSHSRESKTRKLEELQEELHILNKDIQQVESRHGALPSTSAPLPALPGIGMREATAPPQHQTGDRASIGQQSGFSGLPLAAPWGLTSRREGGPVRRAESTSLGAEGEPSANLALEYKRDQRRGRASQTAVSSLSSPAEPQSCPPIMRRLGSSSLFQSNGQHISNSVLGLDLLDADRAAGAGHPRVLEEATTSERQLASSSLQMSSEPTGLLSSCASLRHHGNSSFPVQAAPQGRQPNSLTISAAGHATGTFLSPSSLSHTIDPLGAERLSDVPGPGGEGAVRTVAPHVNLLADLSSMRRGSSDPSSSMTSLATGTTRSTSEAANGEDPHTRARKRRFQSQFEDLQSHYLRMRQRQLDGKKPRQRDRGEATPGKNRMNGRVCSPQERESAAVLASEGPSEGGEYGRGGGDGMAAASGPDDLKEFSRMLSMFTHNIQLKVLAAIPGASQRTSAAILSSIAFDRNARLFATAGVSKRIALFNYQDVIGAAEQSSDLQAPNTPTAELVSRSKLSCLSWNCLLEHQLISSDYEGVVTLWDASAGQPVTEYEAHDKRIWSIDFCPSDANLLVSGSDDGFVKVWSTSQANSVASIDMKANVCCVNYNPENHHQVAIGSADHNVHLYDTRNVASPVYVFSGHRKAVSYVRFMGGRELVSASTDSTLRLWSTQDYEPLRTYSGHVNEKNFVGLSLSGEFVACGSETSEVFIYYRSMSKPMARQVFSQPASLPTNSAASSGPSRQNLHFISSVCWKPSSQTLLAANSQGAIKVLQLSS